MSDRGRGGGRGRRGRDGNKYGYKQRRQGGAGGRGDRPSGAQERPRPPQQEEPPMSGRSMETGEQSTLGAGPRQQPPSDDWQQVRRRGHSGGQQRTVSERRDTQSDRYTPASTSEQRRPGGAGGKDDRLSGAQERSRPPQKEEPPMSGRNMERGEQSTLGAGPHQQPPSDDWQQVRRRGHSGGHQRTLHERRDESHVQSDRYTPAGPQTVRQTVQQPSRPSVPPDRETRPPQQRKSEGTKNVGTGDRSTLDPKSQQQPTPGSWQQAEGRGRRRQGEEHQRVPSETGRGPAASREPRDRYLLTPAEPQPGTAPMQQPGRHVPQPESPRSSGGRDGGRSPPAGATPHGPPTGTKPQQLAPTGGLPPRDSPQQGDLSTLGPGSQQQHPSGGRKDTGKKKRKKQGEGHQRVSSETGRGPAESCEPSDRYTLTPAEPRPGTASMQQPGRHVPQPESPSTSGGRDSAQTSRSPPAGATPHGPPTGTRPQQQASPGGLPSKSSPLNGSGRGNPLPRRPGVGSEGTPIELKTNFFQVKIPQSMTLYHYDVEIQPKVPRKLKQQVIHEAIRKNSRLFSGQCPVFDGVKNMYCHRKLSEDKIRLPDVSLSKDEEKEKTFKVEMKYTGHMMQLDDLERLMGDPGQRMDIIQALDIVLRQSASLRPEVVSVGRSFFTPTHAQTLGEGTEVWYGYHQSLRPLMWKTMLLNIDIAATAFYKEQPVIEFMKEVLRREFDVTSPLNDLVRCKFAKEIKGLKIEVTHLSYPRRYKVNDVTRGTASELTFPLDGHECTVQRYFLDKYSRRLDYPHLPCLHVGPKEKHIYIPLECCKIAKGQRCAKKLTDVQLRSMIGHTTKPPVKRMRDIQKSVKDANYNQDKYLLDYGLSVSNEMETVPGRVLSAPAIQYKEETVTPQDGAWKIGKQKFWNGVKIQNWAVACTVPEFLMSKGEIRHFTSRLMKHSRALGMPILQEPLVEYQRRGQSPADMFKSLMESESKLQLIMAVLPRKGGGSGYAEVKRAGDNQLGVRTQCVVADTVKNAGFSTLTNICLKINAKLGGTNNTLSAHNEESHILIAKPTIVMGADVTHPAPGETKKPSIAALVASMDVNATRYRADTRVQEPRKEIITDLKEMVKDMMRAFRCANHGVRPERIIFYRDGVSEGQFQSVLENELQALQRACHELEPGYEPGITFVVVQKRHHARLFPVKDCDKVGRSGNVLAGTTVDQGITHPTDHDFYLCSHAGIQGTSRPCHYYVIHDDNDFSADDMQGLSYQLCHLFFRCNRSVSYPAPAYYAHLAAYRARYLLQGWEDKSSDSASSASGQSEAQWSRAEMAEAIKIKEEIKKTGMYFA